VLAATQLAGFGARRTPIVRSTASYGASSNIATHSIPLPASYSAGDLLLIFTSNIGGSTPGTPSGWTQLFLATATPSRSVTLACFYKIAAGGEGSSVSITWSASTASVVAHSVAVKDAKAPPVAGTAATGLGTSPNPPAASPTGGAVPALAFAIAENTEVGNSVSAYPSGYEGGTYLASAGGTNILAVAWRQIRATAEDPGAFTWTASGSYATNTILAMGA
jgi:hypothetical protein